jgi:hypothetical protein
MATPTISRDVTERNLQLTGEFTRYLLQNPEVLDALPDNFELVILPDNDPELQTYSLALLNHRQMDEERPVVIVRMNAVQTNVTAAVPRFQFYVPVEPLPIAVNGR